MDSSQSPLNPNEIRITHRDFYIAEIINGYNNRKFYLKSNTVQTWPIEKQCSLIESIIIRVPIGNFVVEAYENHTLKDYGKTIIDGSQRFLAIQMFVKNEFALCDMKYLPNLNGKTCSTLPRHLQRRFEETYINCYELDLGMSENVKKDLVERMK